MAVFEDIVVTPHCDMHVAMTGTPPVKITVFERWFKPDPFTVSGADKRIYELKDVTAACKFEIFSPYETPGTRMITPFVSIDNVGNVSPLAMGVNFIYISHKNTFGHEHSIVIRIQVHHQVLGWWFGNSSLTVAKDDACAHTQVSIYALFTDDGKKTDLVGDITGHGYVNLTSSDNNVFEPDASGSGRLWGKIPGTPATLNGTFLGSTKSIPVKVVDYKQQRNILEPVQYVKPFQEAHNMVFISEGFIDSGDDRKRFDEIVTKTVDRLFHKPRHAPYNILQGSFNVFKVFQASEQRVITSAAGINDEDDPNLPKGYQIPYSNALPATVANPYTLEELIMKVGLPLRNETRSTTDLKKLWTDSFLDYDPSKVDDDLVRAWKKQRSMGILEARDSFFGMQYGRRYADGYSKATQTAMTIPVADVDTPAMRAYVKRLYEWFYTSPTRLVAPDPRRHPPQVHKSNEPNPSNIVMQYLTSLHYRYDPSQHIGLQWEPDVNGGTFKPSVGFVGVIVNDGLTGGANLNNSTFTTTSVNKFTKLGFQYFNTPTEKILRRIPPDEIPLSIDEVINTIAHEFGHSFNFGDEYESFSGDNDGIHDGYDNVTTIHTIKLDANYTTNRKIDPDKVKWFALPRIELSNTLLEPSTQVGNELKVKIDPKYIGKWIEAQIKNKIVHIRKPEFDNNGKQLPQPSDDAHYLVLLQIKNIDAATGFITLGGSGLPSPPLPVFPKGSFIFVPLLDDAGNLKFIVEKKVYDFLKNDPTNKNLPLNSDSDRGKVNADVDYPKDIAGFAPACCDGEKTVGVYEGANYYTGMQYRPAGGCKMRTSGESGDGEFCHVCKYLMVNRVDPQYHDLLDKKYYPKAKSSP